MIHIGGKVYIKTDRSAVDHAKVDAFGKVTSINLKTVTVEIWWKEGNHIPRESVRVPRDYIMKEVE